MRNDPPPAAVPGTNGPAGRSYIIPCTAAFRDRVVALAARRGVSVADLARAVLLLVPPAVLAALPDPGEPPPGEREQVTLMSGPSKGRVLRRKPRLQARLAAGYQIAGLRRALALALEIAEGGRVLALADPQAPRRLEAAEEEVERLRLLVGALAFDTLPEGVRSEAEALFVLGFPPGSRPDRRVLREKFRMLAMIFHPDSPYGDGARMSQLNQAMQLLLRRGA
ncbi:MAG: J domain-containing protein [Thalassobaculales bacterium]